MKKSLIALAVMAAAGAACAQSSVQLYGIADVWLGSTTVKDDLGVKIPGEYNGVKFNQTQLSSGGVDASRWGLKGTEDLGGGLKANFQLEQGFDLDTGMQESGQAFSRVATVGLSGSFGAVTLGKQWSAFHDVAENGFATFKSRHLASQRYAYISQFVAPYQENPSNTIKYQSNSYSGFSGAVSYSLGEDKTASQSAGNVVALNGQYAAGPLAVALGYQQEKTNVAPGDQYKPRFATLNGSYDFGSFRLLGDFTHARYDDEFKSHDWSIGAQVPLASNLLLSGAYSAGKLKSDGATELKTQGFSAALAYVLSKRTMAYAGFNTTHHEDDGGDDLLKVRAYAVGVNHKF